MNNQPVASLARYYKDTAGNVYKSVTVGYDKYTNEQSIALKDLKTREVFFMPMVDLYRKHVIKGVPTKDYVEVFNISEDDYPLPAQTEERAYPGFTNDPRPEVPPRYTQSYNGRR